MAIGTSHIKESFARVLADLDFHQSIISRTRGRWKKYPVRTFVYVLRNRLLKLRSKLTGSPFMSVTTFWGDTMRVVFPTYRSIYHFGILDSGELTVQKALVDTLQEGSVFFDVGANVGFYTLLACALVGQSGQVHSFEPTPSTFKQLSENAANKNNVTLNPVALGSKADEATLADFGLLDSGLNSLVRHEQGSLQAHKITVPVTTLDAYCQEKNVKPNMIKIDAEGMEQEVLHGALETLRQARPVLVMEIGPQEESAALVTFILQNGYKGYYSDGHMDLIPYDTNAGHGRINMVFQPQGIYQ